ncbi:MAG: glycosyltransferase 87 family protein [Acidimicrobiales bacterium]
MIRYGFAIRAGFSAANDIDGATYFAGAVQLVYGRLPYRSFAFVQPPGILVLAAPFALASRLFGTAGSFTAVRLVMPLVGVTNVALVGRRVRHRGPIAVLVASGSVAVYLPAVLATRTLLLEPWLDLFCLLALTLAFDRTGALASPRSVGLAGVLFGLAGSVKLWAVFPFLVVLGCCLVAKSPRRAGWLSGGAVGGFGVVVGPFALASSGRFFHDVVWSQLHRFGERVPFTTRMGDVLGINALGQPRPAAIVTIVVVALVAAALLAAAAKATIDLHRRPSALAMAAVAATIVVFVVLMIPGEFPYHYPDFLAPFGGVTAGLAAAAVAERWAPEPRRRRVALAGIAVVLVGASVLDIPLLNYGPGPDFAAAVDLYVPANACVVTDYTAFTISADRYITTDPNCPVIVDPFGWDLTLDNGRTPGPRERPTAALVNAWKSAFKRTNWIVLSDTAHARVPFVRSLRRFIDRNFTRVRGGVIFIWERTSVTPPPGHRRL